MNASMWGVVLMLCWTSVTAHANSKEDRANQRCVDAMPDEDVEQWQRFMDDSFSEQRLGAALWWSGWTSFNVFNITLAADKYATAKTRLARDNWLVSIIGAGLFVTEVSVMPMPGLYGYRKLSRLPAHTPEQRRAKLLRGLSLLDRAAQVEKSNSDIWAHVAGLVYAVASTAYVWVRNTDAPKNRLWLGHGLQFSTAILFAEATLWSVPRRAREHRKLVREVACSGAPSPRTVDVSFGVNGLSINF
ncbi:MAG: hypothetical protein JWN48_761 [Myxococcaceae bacterium]|nr:hypothetical protein [Myxococcaceae bacterium]